MTFIMIPTLRRNWGSELPCRRKPRIKQSLLFLILSFFSTFSLSLSIYFSVTDNIMPWLVCVHMPRGFCIFIRLSILLALIEQLNYEVNKPAMLSPPHFDNASILQWTLIFSDPFPHVIYFLTSLLLLEGGGKPKSQSWWKVWYARRLK